ncbi:MAG TPA: peptidyl-prolyl cis-trans isomerase [Thermoanaerobaculia bacterium]|nr:peptidyl-prolyl cis-trans isomerase [Thermoanaerobaculia bacterium]
MNIPVKLAAGLLLLCSLPGFAGTVAPKLPDDAVLATVNGDRITARNLIDEFSKRHSGHARFLGGDMEARAFLDILIAERLFIQEAYDIGLDQDARTAEAVADFEKEKATALLVRTEVEDKAQATPEEVRAAWQQSLNFFVEVRQIAVETKEEADEIRAGILSGGDVETLARSCSVAESRLNGGHLLVNWGQFSPEWEAAVFALQPGEISPVIATPSGYEVIIVDNRIDSPLPPFDKVSSQVASVLHTRRIDERTRAFSEELWRKYHAELRPVDLAPQALRTLLKTAPDTLLVTWDGGGKLTVRETFSDSDLRMWSSFPPLPARRTIDARIRATVNDPLAVLEAKARNLAADPTIAKQVAKFRENFMEGTLFKEHVLKDVTVSAEEARKYYDEHKTEFVEPEQRHVAHILLATEAEAKAVRQTIAQGADFDHVARTKSRDAATALLDGKIGWITPDKVPAGFKKVLTLAAGEVSEPLKSDHGWHIIKVSEIKPARQIQLEEILPRVTKNALEAKERTIQDRWLEKLHVNARIELDNTAIKRFVADNEFDPNAAPPQHKLN